jgi:hypothetical protein
MVIPETPNKHFNKAIQILLRYHQACAWPGSDGAMLTVTRPRGIRSERDWGLYLNALTAILIIGQRNGWLQLHVNRQGQPVYWLIEV